MNPNGALPRMVFIAGLLALLGGAVFFLSGNPQEPESPFDPRVAIEDCAKRGGSVRTGGMLGSEICFVPYADAGKTCRDGDDCEGNCLLAPIGPTDASSEAVTGRCEPRRPTFGCYGVVEDGRLKHRLCVD